MANMGTKLGNDYRALAKTVFVSAIDGRVDPINLAQGPSAKSTMIRLNAALPVWRCDIARSDAPDAVKQAVRDFRK